MNNKGFSEEIKRKCIPIFSRNKNVTIIKKENGFILSSPKTLSTIRMNNLTYEILMLCNGKNNLLSISNTIRNKYDVSEEKIDQDIANLLYPLWKLKLIMFKNGIIPFKKHFCELPKINPLNAGFHPNNYAKFTCPACLQAYSVLFCSSSDVSPEVINARISS